MDFLWPEQPLVVELDGYVFHGSRGSFERERWRDAALHVAGYRVLRLTYRRLVEETPAGAAELRLLLGG